MSSPQLTRRGPGNREIVFASDYPQEIRKRDFVRDIRALGADGELILSGNVGLLPKRMQF